ncbi:hypothetical protein EK21DRAFT_110384 [Setomelanomma holmii]|uniref:Heterokaryon incompatibility domain-containing protein n=1 Tax=Setomelanomma holmii TaxID=210430 RepID=A0A9P4HCA2_9PLEO|nr:hypothetical protein EK21DRAFT_110384 [Setomelanomma holmii]
MSRKRTSSDANGPDRAAKIRRCDNHDPQPDHTNHTLTTSPDIAGGARLCIKCRKLDLATMFEKPTKRTNLGSLKNYVNVTCTFCTVIWDCIRIHWGSASPLDNDARPQLYIQSKWWGSFGGGTQLQQIHRIILAITQQPPKFQLNRRVLQTDKRNRFILAELELLTKTLNGHHERFTLRRSIERHLDLDMIRRWIEPCEDHNCVPRSDDGLFQLGFRLIDVEEARLVVKIGPCDYLALSYVWRCDDPFALRLTKGNKHRQQQSGALKESTKSVGKRMPRTIVDAIEFCKAINQKYLWVDCMCIVQDDVQEKQRLIHGMGHVYENASLTIFATSGQHTDAGLAVISPREDLGREERYVIPSASTSMTISIARTSLEEQIRKSY